MARSPEAILHNLVRSAVEFGCNPWPSPQKSEMVSFMMAFISSHFSPEIVSPSDIMSFTKAERCSEAFVKDMMSDGETISGEKCEEMKAIMKLTISDF